MNNLDFGAFDGNDDLDEVLQRFIDEGFVPRDPTVAEMLFLPHDADTEVTMVLERPDMTLHLVKEENDENIDSTK